MNDLPSHGQRVKVWPVPGKGTPAAPVSIGQESFNLMQPDGQEVVWSTHYYELLLHGQIALHDPRHPTHHPKSHPQAGQPHPLAGQHAIRTFTAAPHFHQHADPEEARQKAAADPGWAVACAAKHAEWSKAKDSSREGKAATPTVEGKG